MFKKNKTWLVLMVLIGLSLAGDINAQIVKANKLLDEGNVITKKKNELFAKANDLFIELFHDNLAKAVDIETYEDIKAWKEKNKSKFDEVINLFGQIERLAAESIDKYEQASKLKLPEKFKEYTSIKIQEFKKRADGHKLVAPFIKEFLQTYDGVKLIKVMEDYGKQTADIIKEADKLSEKAGQIAKDNPKVIKIKN